MKTYKFTFRHSDSEPTLGTFTILAAGENSEAAQDDAVELAGQAHMSVGSITRVQRVRS